MSKKEIMFLVYWASHYSFESEDICICRTEESAKKKCDELGDGYHYRELEVIE